MFKWLKKGKSNNVSEESVANAELDADMQMQISPSEIVPEPLKNRETELASARTPSEDMIELAAPNPSKTRLFQGLRSGLKRTRGQFVLGLANLFLGKKKVDADLLEQIETQLLSADVGTAATQRLIQDMTNRVRRNELADSSVLFEAVQQALLEVLLPCQSTLVMDKKPFVLLMVGVNGAGKTTTIGKLAKRLKQEGKSVMLAAGDTFRAAAIDQLKVWGERNHVSVIAQHAGADSASVIFDAFSAARARHVDVLIADTAGRLHTQSHLMDELKKNKTCYWKIRPSSPS